MAFKGGDKVEVASKEFGFVGSYYSATVVRQVGHQEFIVQYKNLVKDDFSGPLLEIVTGEELRPVPPKIPASVFRLGEEVDAFDNEGWWVGKINGRIRDEYSVYFEKSTKDVHVYPAARLRVHRDWVKGQWRISSY